MQKSEMEIAYLLKDLAKELEQEKKLDQERKAKLPVRAGDVFETASGDCQVLEYIDSKNVRIRFLSTGYEATVTACNLRSGKVKDKLATSIHGIGCLGEASAIDEGGKVKRSYSHYQNMLQRVTTRDGYKHVKISPEYLNFQYFEEAFDYLTSFYPDSKRQNLALDSDLIPFVLNQGKCYSRDTSILIPHALNSSFASLTKSIKAAKESAEDEFLPCMSRYNKNENTFVLNLKDEAVKFSVLDLAEAKQYLIDYKIEAFVSAFNLKCLPYLPPEKKAILRRLEPALRAL